MSKYEFLKSRIQYLEHMITASRFQKAETKIMSVQDSVALRIIACIQSFFSLCSYYRRIFENFATVVAFQTDLKEKKN